MENICIIDTETTGLDHTKGNVLEIAAIFYNVPTRSIISQCSTLLYAEVNPAFEINRIDVKTSMKTPEQIELRSKYLLIQMMLDADAIVAHNAEFDKKWIETDAHFQEASFNKKWICTKNDVVWPIRKGVPLNLIHICADLGVPIVSTHRALADCLLLLNAIEHVTDIEHFLLQSGADRVIYYADIAYADRQLVKDNGFQWDNVNRMWFAKLTPEIASTMPFNVYQVK